LREQLAAGALRSARNRTWERTLERLADGYQQALMGHDRQHLRTDDRAA
jgi:hypothetical protein